jgi:alcohol dehydrogenase
MIRAGGRVANKGVHGRPAALHLEKLWIRDVTVTTGLVDTHTIPRLMRLVASGRLDPTIFATHRFALDDKMGAYDTFADAVSTKALKVVPRAASELPARTIASWPHPNDPVRPAGRHRHATGDDLT